MAAEHDVVVYSGTKKGFKEWNEDVHFAWASACGTVVVGGVMDGHSGYEGRLAADTTKVCIENWIQATQVETMQEWPLEVWQEQMSALFKTAHEAIRLCLLQSAGTYLDADRVVRYSNGLAVRGGTTVTLVCTVKKPDGSVRVVTANVGDSLAGLITPQNNFVGLTVAHKPDNADEFRRVQALPAELYPVKLRFVYDLLVAVNKDSCPNIFKPDGTPTDREVKGSYINTVRRDKAVYAVNSFKSEKDVTCIAMTRSLGDFYAHALGLTHEPTTSLVELSAQEAQGTTVAIATDGVWDCWEFTDFAATLNGYLNQGTPFSVSANKMLQDTATRGSQYFKSSQLDDATFVAWQI